ncbi:MAG: hypothetical protein K2X55_17975 [Burkholderiaceae bacterium]|nr:hypothetical protein [Burkholderiaceae bacterium]
MKNPTFNSAVLMCDCPQLAAQLSVALSERGKYLAVMDAPRLSRGDAKGEVIRRTNALAQTGSKKLIVAGVSDAVRASLKGHVPDSFIRSVADLSDDELRAVGLRLKKGGVITANPNNLGPSLLLALREKKQLAFSEEEPELRHVPPVSTHLVVCEDKNQLSQVIAANYAFAIGAGLQLIPTPDEGFVVDTNDRFYSAKSDEHGSTTSKLEDLASLLRESMGDIELDGVQSVTFITSGLPWGFGLQELPTTHLFIYPDLGLSIIHGVAASLGDAKPLRLVAMVDPGQVQSSEVVKAGRSLVDRGALIMAFRQHRASVRTVSMLMELLPYDLLFIATHCGDVKGYRETHVFKDASGTERTLVLDTALQVTAAGRDDKVEVKAYEKFVSIDGVPWEDKEQRMRAVGSALLDFYKEPLGRRQPASREENVRVVGSAALAMHDGNLLATPMNTGANSFPLIFNNACVSWHELAGRFMFGGARGYIGTLIEVADSEAQEVAMGVLDEYFGRPLAHALWSAQNKVSGSGIRRPYVMVGVHFQRLRSEFKPPHDHIMARMRDGYEYWRGQLAKLPNGSKSDRYYDMERRVAFLRDCINDFSPRKGYYPTDVL